MSYNIIEEVDYNPKHVVHVKKQVWDQAKQEFVPRTFIRYHRDSYSEIDRDCTMLSECYGQPQYQGTWWVERSQRFIWLSESAATFWTLKNA